METIIPFFLFVKQKLHYRLLDCFKSHEYLFLAMTLFFFSLWPMDNDLSKEALLVPY
jgi:hypothetical protein